MRLQGARSGRQKRRLKVQHRISPVALRDFGSGCFATFREFQLLHAATCHGLGSRLTNSKRAHSRSAVLQKGPFFAATDRRDASVHGAPQPAASGRPGAGGSFLCFAQLRDLGGGGCRKDAPKL